MSEFGSDIQQIKYLLQKIDERNTSIDEVINEMKNDFLQLKNTLVGNKEYKIKGIVDEVAEIKDYVHRDKLVKNKILGGLAVIGLIWTVLLKFLGQWFKT